MSDQLEMTPIKWGENSDGVVVVKKAIPEVDSGEDERRVWILDVLSDLPSRDRSEGLSPAAEVYHAQASEELWSTTVKRKPLKTRKAIHVTMEDADGNVILDDVGAEIRYATLKYASGVQVQVARIKVRGVPLERSNAIVGVLEKRVSLSVTQDQQSLATAVKTDAPEDGQVVTGRSGDDIVVGRMVRQDTKGNAVVDDFGVIYTLEQVTTALYLEVVDDSDLEDHLQRFVAECGDARPSWSVVMEAMGQCWASGKVQPADATTAYLNEAVIDEAIAMVSPSEELPPEPEEEAEKPKARKPRRQVVKA